MLTEPKVVRRRKIVRTIGKSALIGFLLLAFGGFMFNLGHSVVAVRTDNPVVFTNGMRNREAKVFRLKLGGAIVKTDEFYLLHYSATGYQVFHRSRQYSELGPFLVGPLLDDELQIKAPLSEPLLHWNPKLRETKEGVEFRTLEGARIEMQNL